MCQRNPLPPHFSLKIELVDSSENLAPICQRHIAEVCNIVVLFILVINQLDAQNFVLQ